MNKKLRSLICFVLIVVISIPTISVVFAGKPDKGPLEKVVFIHYKKGYGKPQKEDKGYYTLLVKGAKWRDLSIDVVTGTGIDISVITASTGEWDSHTTADLFGSVTYKANADWDSSSPDGDNELVFGDYPQDGVIAICIVWGYFGGRPRQREIIEFDIMFDTDYEWSLSGESDKMDLQNIATHELGHGAGLGDLYKLRASEETMYGYSTEGETKKRTLYFGDIAGIQELYGP